MTSSRYDQSQEFVPPIGGSDESADSGRVLIIADSEFMRRILITVVALDHCQVLVAPHGGEGLEAIGTWQPAIILVDGDGPLDDCGPQFRRYRSRTGSRTAIVALVNAKLSDAQQSEFGVTDSLAKPFSITDLLGLLRRYVRCG